MSSIGALLDPASRVSRAKRANSLLSPVSPGRLCSQGSALSDTNLDYQVILISRKGWTTEYEVKEDFFYQRNITGNICVSGELRVLSLIVCYVQSNIVRAKVRSVSFFSFLITTGAVNTKRYGYFIIYFSFVCRCMTKFNAQGTQKCSSLIICTFCQGYMHTRGTWCDRPERLLGIFIPFNDSLIPSAMQHGSFELSDSQTRVLHN